MLIMCNSPLELFLWVWALDDGCFSRDITLHRSLHRKEAIGVEVFQRVAVEDRSDCMY